MTQSQASKFWEEYGTKDNYRLHLCDVPKEVFYSRHKNALKLITEKGLPPEDIGLYIAGKYYSHVWGSRSCSGYLAQLLGLKDYLTFYCMSSVYFFSVQYNENAYTQFVKADELDNQM